MSCRDFTKSIRPMEKRRGIGKKIVTNNWEKNVYSNAETADRSGQHPTVFFTPSVVYMSGIFPNGIRTVDAAFAR